MKKNIILLITIIALIFLILFLRVNIKKDNSNPLQENLINNYTYGYNLDNEQSTINNIYVDNENIYYLLVDTINDSNQLYNYKLKKLNIYNNETTEIKNYTNTKDDCYLNNNYIYCTGINNFTVYNLKFEEIYTYQYNEESNVNFIPYKDTYLKLSQNNLKLIINNEEKLFRTINSNIPLYYKDYLKTSNNSYILFNDDNDYYYIYNINSNTIKTIEYQNYFSFAEGFVFYNDKTFNIYNLVTEKNMEYENNLETSYFYTSTMSQDRNTLYLYNIIDDIILIIDLKSEKIAKLELLYAKDNPISHLLVKDNYLYINILQDENNFYIIDLDKLDLPLIDTNDYQNEISSKVANDINNFEQNYHININVKEDAIINFPDFSAEKVINNNIIIKALNKLESILVKYDKTFFESFYNNGYEGLNLYLTGKLTPSNYETQVSNPAAYSLIYNKKYMIVIDINQPNIEELLCHELMHNIEFNLKNQNISSFSNWQAYNPQDFYYNNSYTTTKIFDYTLNEQEINNVYFIDFYSHTYEAEDRARIFEKICSCNSESLINDYPHLYQKGLYIKQEIAKYYPNLLNTKLFASLK